MAVEDVISEAMQDAGLAEMSDMGELVGVEETPSEAAPETPADESEKPVETKETDTPTETATAEGDDLDKELEGLGIKGKNEHGQETRIRYSRIRRIHENFKKKLQAEWDAAHKKTTDDLQGKLSANAERLEYMNRIEQLLQDPSGAGAKRYFEMLAVASPHIRQVLSQALFQAAGGNGTPAATPAADQDPEPQPDYKFADGSLGYSPEAFKKHNEWNRRQAVRESKAEMEKLYGDPIKKMTQRDREVQEQRVHTERVNANVQQAKTLYGQVFTDDFGEIGNIKPTSEILAKIRESNQVGRSLSFMDACAMVLIPKIQANRNTMREELTKELGERPAAARRSTPAATTTTTETPKTLEGIIEGEMRKAGMLGG